ncbi:MAG TPA: hypothetical protein VJS69_01175 [Candidatus Krumholzibacteria bacterium]|nr:hypothetical protein [Candidatus Krumholzibacteria bacterium]
MGYVTLFATCALCRAPFSANPLRVPSIRMKGGTPDPEGIREPLCAACYEGIREAQRRAGMEVSPPPAPDAYEEVDERELPDDE